MSRRSAADISTISGSSSSSPSSSTDDDENDDADENENGGGGGGATGRVALRGRRSSHLTDRLPRKPCMRLIAAASSLLCDAAAAAEPEPPLPLRSGTSSTDTTSSPACMPAASAAMFSGAATTAIRPPLTPYANRGVSHPRSTTVYRPTISGASRCSSFSSPCKVLARFSSSRSRRRWARLSCFPSSFSRASHAARSCQHHVNITTTSRRQVRSGHVTSRHVMSTGVHLIESI
jgi:hypothetical protein